MKLTKKYLTRLIQECINESVELKSLVVPFVRKTIATAMPFAKLEEDGEDEFLDYTILFQTQSVNYFYFQVTFSFKEKDSKFKIHFNYGPSTKNQKTKADFTNADDEMITMGFVYSTKEIDNDIDIRNRFEKQFAIDLQKFKTKFIDFMKKNTKKKMH